MSKNNGLSWDSIESNWSADQISVFSAYNNYLFAGANGKVFISSNNGMNWSDDNSGLPGNTINALAVTDQYIYAAVQGNGVWRKNFGK